MIKIAKGFYVQYVGYRDWLHIVKVGRLWFRFHHNFVVHPRDDISVFIRGQKPHATKREALINDIGKEW